MKLKMTEKRIKTISVVLDILTLTLFTLKIFGLNVSWWLVTMPIWFPFLTLVIDAIITNIVSDCKRIFQ